MTRLSWEQYALELAKAASLRSEDPYLQVGACVLRFDNTVAAVGYNGAPPDVIIDWTNREERRIKVSHAEASCLRYVRPNECRLIACTTKPCPSCVTLIASYKIPEIIYLNDFEGDTENLSSRLCNEFNIKITKMEEV